MTAGATADARGSRAGKARAGMTGAGKAGVERGAGPGRRPRAGGRLRGWGGAAAMAAVCALTAAAALLPLAAYGGGGGYGPAGAGVADRARTAEAGATGAAGAAGAPGMAWDKAHGVLSANGPGRAAAWGPAAAPAAAGNAGPTDGADRAGAAGDAGTADSTGAADDGGAADGEDETEAAETVNAPAAQECTEPERSLAPSSADGPAVDAIKARGKLIVGVDQNSYRWGYRNPATGNLEGFDIDLARAIAEDILGSPKAVIFRAIPTNQRIPALDRGTVDLVVRTMTINCARLKQVSFSTAYFEAGQQVLAPKSSSITGYDSSLAGKKVCSAEGSTAYEALERNSFGATFRDEHDGSAEDEDLLTVPNQLDCLVRLQLGLVDAVVTDNALAAGQAAQDPAVELKGGKPFTTEYYGVAAALGKDDLVRRVNQVLVEYREGAWQQAYDKWLAADLPGVTGPPAPKYRPE